MKALGFQFEINSEHFPLLTVQPLLSILMVLGSLPMSITTYPQHDMDDFLQLRP